MTGNDRTAMVIIIANISRGENVKSGCILDGKEALPKKVEVELSVFHVGIGDE